MGLMLRESDDAIKIAVFRFYLQNIFVVSLFLFL